MLLPAGMMAGPLNSKVPLVRVTWFTVALFCTATVILAVLTIVLSSLAKTPSGGQRVHSEKAGGLAKVLGWQTPVKRPSHKPAPLNHTVDLYCVLDVQVALSESFDIIDAPVLYCNNLIICCIMDVFYELEWHVWNAIETVKHMSPDTTIFVGFKAEGHTRGDWFYSEIKKTNRTTEMVHKILRTVQGHDINGGAFIWLPNFEEVPDKHMVTLFLSYMSVEFEVVRKKLIITLPEKEEHLRSYFPVSIVRKPHVYFVMKSHYVPPYNMTDYMLSCSGPWRYPDSENTVHKTLVKVNRWLRNHVEVMTPKLLMSFDATAYSYYAQDLFPYHLTGRAPIPYREFCLVCSTVQQHVRFWKTYKDSHTSCNAAVAEQTVKTVVSPEMVHNMQAFFSYNVRAFIVYNVHMDDFTGVCGNKFGFLRRLYCQIENVPENRCREIGLE